VRLFGRIGQALIEAKQAGRDPFAAIEAVMSWDAFAESVTEAQRSRSQDFDFLHRIGELRHAAATRRNFSTCSSCGPRPPPSVLDAIEVLRSMNSDNARKVPADAPTDFIKPRWQKLVMTDTGIDRRYYELCALSEAEERCAPATSGCKARASSRTSRTTWCRPRNSPASSRPANAAGRGHRLRPVPA
jgi:hypothetical protein